MDHWRKEALWRWHLPCESKGVELMTTNESSNSGIHAFQCIGETHYCKSTDRWCLIESNHSTLPFLSTATSWTTSTPPASTCCKAWRNCSIATISILKAPHCWHGPKKRPHYWPTTAPTLWIASTSSKSHYSTYPSGSTCSKSFSSNSGIRHLTKLHSQSSETASSRDKLKYVSPDIL